MDDVQEDRLRGGGAADDGRLHMAAAPSTHGVLRVFAWSSMATTVVHTGRRHRGK